MKLHQVRTVLLSGMCWHSGMLTQRVCLISLGILNAMPGREESLTNVAPQH